MEYLFKKAPKASNALFLFVLPVLLVRIKKPVHTTNKKALDAFLQKKDNYLFDKN